MVIPPAPTGKESETIDQFKPCLWAVLPRRSIRMTRTTLLPAPEQFEKEGRSHATGAENHLFWGTGGLDLQDGGPTEVVLPLGSWRAQRRQQEMHVAGLHRSCM